MSAADASVARLAALFAGAQRAVAFTGAGVSTESGIPDFRSPGGVWARFDPREFTYANFMGSVEGRRRYWALGRVTYPLIRAAAPNPAHLALAELHRRGRLDCCITQNIDALHQRAGLPEAAVVELHGNATRARCLECGAAYSRDALHAQLEQGVEVPDCERCGGVVKPHTVLFGEAMPAGAIEEARRRAEAADLLVVLGSSLVVYPAAYVPRYAKQAGAALVIVNLEPTPLDREADLVLRARAGVVMAAVLDLVSAGAPVSREG
ncbi:MAG TPA: Sir2 family NAD-dependent protein deacetylase [Methylomirabilota bacterium]|nr:Sir2 family NAD-dependent protein deacetylase [Methylomirabilota bacterium]